VSSFTDDLSHPDAIETTRPIRKGPRRRILVTARRPGESRLTAATAVARPEVPEARLVPQSCPIPALEPFGSRGRSGTGGGCESIAPMSEPPAMIKRCEASGLITTAAGDSLFPFDARWRLLLQAHVSRVISIFRRYFIRREAGVEPRNLFIGL
jgi:hypothetical protein